MAAAPGTTIIPPVQPLPDPAGQAEPYRLGPLPLPLPPVGGVTTTPARRVRGRRPGRSRLRSLRRRRATDLAVLIERGCVMLTLGTRLKNIAFLVIGVLVLGFIGVRYADLGGWSGCAATTSSRWTSPRPAGCSRRSDVTYRGVSVGRVGDLRLTATGVRADLQHHQLRAEDPAQLRAVVANLSAVGEEYVDLRPSTDERPVPGRRRDHPAERHPDPAAGDQPAHQRQRPGRLGAAGLAAHRRGRARQGVPGAGREPPDAAGHRRRPHPGRRRPACPPPTS